YVHLVERCTQRTIVVLMGFSKDLFTSCVDNGILQDSFDPSNDNTNVANALQEPFVVKQDPEPFNQTIKELPPTVLSFDPTCYSEDGNSFTYDSTSNLDHDSPNSFFDEDIPKKIYSNPLFDEEIISMKIHFNAESYLIESLLNHDSSIISSSSKIDSLFDERIISENSDAAFESFSPSHIPVEDSDPLMEEINLSFTLDNPMPSGIKEDDYDSEEDILILEELLGNDCLSFPKNKSFHFDIPSSSGPPAKPPDGNTGILNFKVMGDIFKHKVPMPRIMFTQSTIVPNKRNLLFSYLIGAMKLFGLLLNARR
nr:hypothetical protein [Tanacetum cinerariifolium]